MDRWELKCHIYYTGWNKFRLWQWKSNTFLVAGRHRTTGAERFLKPPLKENVVRLVSAFSFLSPLVMAVSVIAALAGSRRASNEPQ